MDTNSFSDVRNYFSKVLLKIVLQGVKAAETTVWQRTLKIIRYQRKHAKLQLLQDSSQLKWYEQCTTWKSWYSRATWRTIQNVELMSMKHKEHT
jgi:hypothetical protein